MTFFARGAKWPALGANGWTNAGAAAADRCSRLASAIPPRPMAHRLRKCRRVRCGTCSAKVGNCMGQWTSGKRQKRMGGSWPVSNERRTRLAKGESGYGKSSFAGDGLVEVEEYPGDGQPAPPALILLAVPGLRGLLGIKFEQTRFFRFAGRAHETQAECEINLLR